MVYTLANIQVVRALRRGVEQPIDEDAAVQAAMGLLTDPGTPFEVREVMQGGFRGEVCALAIMHALEQRNRLDRAVALALCETYASGQRDGLRLLAALAPGEVSTALVPLEARIDLDASQSAHDKHVARFQQWFEELSPEDRARADSLAALDRDRPMR
jgi:hypothetical protein